MNAFEAKRDCKVRLQKANVLFEKLTARTVGMSDLARCSPVFVTVHGATFPVVAGCDWDKTLFADVPKPSAGGYIVEYKGCHLAAA